MKKLKNCIINTLIIPVLIFFACDITLISQQITLDYIFRDPPIINPRPSFKSLHTSSGKFYYYADHDYDDILTLFKYSYKDKITYEFPDSTDISSEFIITPDGDALCIIEGDLYITKNFVYTRTFTKDIRITQTDDYEYSPEFLSDSLFMFRRSGNYYIALLSTGKCYELQLTDEDDTLSYQLLAYHVSAKTARILFAEYDRSSRREFIFPDYNNEFVNIKKSYRGFSNISYIEHEIRLHKGTLNHTQHKFYFKDSSVYSAYKALYSPDGKYIIMDADSKSRNTRKIFRYDPKAKTFDEIYFESTDSWFERHSGKIIFISSTEFLFESESSGFNNIYKLNITGGMPVNLTNGNFTVTDFTTDTSAGKIYFTANVENPLVYSIYETDFIPSYLRQLTHSEGGHYDLITDGSGYLFYKYSYITQPEELYVMELNTLNESRLTYTVSPAFSEINWSVPETITFYNTEDGQKIYGFLYKPQDFNPGRKYPLICFAHGAGYLQNVTTSFSPYQDNFMFNTFLNQNGFLVLDIDFRGSAGYGKDFRTKTYKNLGYWEVSDYISGIMYLDSLGIIDRNNVGIYGGSYGGFITLMAAFQRPDIFSCGVSLRAVTDWKNYYYSNPRYTIARLGEYNSSNIEYYEISSPITYASQLKIPLLITHGMLDDNVFFQDMVQLTQELIDERKDFEIMFHPRESHRYSRQTSWLDLYKRTWKFFEEHLK